MVLTSYRPGFSKTSKRWINWFTEMDQRCTANANKKDQKLDQRKRSTAETNQRNRSENKINPERSDQKWRSTPKSRIRQKDRSRESGLDQKSSETQIKTTHKNQKITRKSKDRKTNQLHQKRFKQDQLHRKQQSTTLQKFIFFLLRRLPAWRCWSFRVVFS